MKYIAVIITPDGAEKINRKTGKPAYIELGEYPDLVTAIANAKLTLNCTSQVGLVILKGKNLGGYVVMSDSDYLMYY